MAKKTNGFTLVELVLSVALLGVVLQLAFSLLGFGQNIFNMSTGQGFSQQSVRLISDFLSNELKYAALIDDKSDDLITNYYSLEYDTFEQRLIVKKYTGEDGLTVNEVKTIRGSWDVLKITSVDTTMLAVQVGQQEVVGNRTSRFDLPFSITLPNAFNTNPIVDLNLLEKDSEDNPNRLYYKLAVDVHVAVTIDASDLSPGENEDEDGDEDEVLEQVVIGTTSFGGIISIDNNPPQIEGGRYKVKFANHGGSEIKIKLENYTAEHAGKVTVSAKNASSIFVLDSPDNLESITFAAVANKNGSVEFAITISIETKGHSNIIEQDFLFVTSNK